MITVTFLPNAYWKHIGIGFHSWFLSGQQMSDNKQESITVNHQENILDTVGRDTWRWYIKSKLDQNHYKFLKFAESLTACMYENKLFSLCWNNLQLEVDIHSQKTCTLILHFETWKM